MSQPTSRLTRWLQSRPRSIRVGYAMTAAFCTYFCMYAFRKPVFAAQFEGAGTGFAGMELKTAFAISQIIGYTISKYVGIKVCSEMSRGRRASCLVLLILAAETALFFFAFLPGNWKIVAIFANGLPLGMVWGLVVWHLEGRRTSELLLAGLSCSFIVASGVVKDVGRFLIRDLQVSEWWMPSLTGLIFLVPFLVSVWLLNQIPQPSEADVRSRVAREPMRGPARREFIKRFGPGLILLMVVYFFLTAFRDFRDLYGVEIFKELGYQQEPALFTKAEFLVALGVLAALAALVMIKDNRLGLLGAYGIMTAGFVVMGGSTLLLDAGMINGFWWMTLVGLGSYLVYVPYGSVLFDRLIASTRFVGTAVFAIYVADAIGYTGSVMLQFSKDYAQGELSRLDFFRGFTYMASVAGMILLIASAAYFMRKTRPEIQPTS